jgi:hypothetical protein
VIAQLYIARCIVAAVQLDAAAASRTGKRVCVVLALLCLQALCC